jgi:outer membrane lipoprotein carrier protein
MHRLKALLPILLCAVTLHAQSPTTLAKLVDAHYNHLQSLQCHYTERYQGMNMDRTETGTLTLRKPGKMRWAYDASPGAPAAAGKLFLLDGRNAITYTPGDTQAQSFPAKELDDLRSPLRFLLGHTELSKELDHLTLTPGPIDPSTAGQLTYTGQLSTLSGTPKGMSARIHLLSLTVDSAGRIQAMRLEETDGSRTTFTFTNIHENIPTPDSDFIFTPPPGVTVVQGANPI